MKQLISIEEVTMFLLAIFAFSYLDYSWWVFPALLLLPDLSMLGYIFNAKIGSIIYNVFHHKALALLLFMLGLYCSWAIVQLTGIVLFAHSSMDRALGYGLKYFTGFNDTHLGKIGRRN